jgi:hypothetical protein
VELLRKEENLEIMLLAARTLTYILDFDPNLDTYVVSSGKFLFL